MRTMRRAVLLFALVGSAVALIHGSGAAVTAPPDAPKVDCLTECIPKNGDCRRFEHCQHCRSCYPDEVPLVLVSSGGRLHVSWEHGEEFYVKGVNWSGSEAELTVPEGLHQRSMDEILDFAADNGFNAIRIMLNHHCVLEDCELNPDGFDSTKNPELVQQRYLSMLLLLARKAADRHLLLALCVSRMRGTEPSNGLWYDAVTSEEDVLRSWHTLAGQLCPEWNVFAVDLQDEPYAASWGKNYPEDWNRAAERIGNFVHTECVRWLIMVQGVGFTPGALGDQGSRGGYWYGENLVGVHDVPIQIKNMQRLVYAPHTFGPGVYDQPYFDLEPCQRGLLSSHCFPGNMPEVWDEHFGFVQHRTGRAVLVGAWGGIYEAADELWQQAAAGYFAERGIGSFYFCLNPGSVDTGGLLGHDWYTPELHKLKLLEQLPVSDVIITMLKVSRDLEPPPPPNPPPPPIPKLPTQEAEGKALFDFIEQEAATREGEEDNWVSGNDAEDVVQFDLEQLRHDLNEEEKLLDPSLPEAEYEPLASLFAPAGSIDEQELAERRVEQRHFQDLQVRTRELVSGVLLVVTCVVGGLRMLGIRKVRLWLHARRWRLKRALGLVEPTDLAVQRKGRETARREKGRYGSLTNGDDDDVEEGGVGGQQEEGRGEGEEGEFDEDDTSDDETVIALQPIPSSQQRAQQKEQPAARPEPAENKRQGRKGGTKRRDDKRVRRKERDRQTPPRADASELRPSFPEREADAPLGMVSVPFDDSHLTGPSGSPERKSRRARPPRRTESAAVASVPIAPPGSAHRDNMSDEINVGVCIKDRASGIVSISGAQIHLSRTTTFEQLQASLAAAATGMQVITVHFLDGNTPSPLLNELGLRRAVALGVKTLYVSADVSVAHHQPTHEGLCLEMDDSGSDVTLAAVAQPESYSQGTTGEDDNDDRRTFIM